jgi:hypothetical protein
LRRVLVIGILNLFEIWCSRFEIYYMQTFTNATVLGFIARQIYLLKIPPASPAVDKSPDHGRKTAKVTVFYGRYIPGSQGTKRA